MKPDFGVVILTMGKRPEDLRTAIDSVLAQRDVSVDVVVVGNGWEPTGLPSGVATLGLTENVGIPAGRNAGVPLVDGDLLFFLDDDASIPDPHFLASVKGRFDSDPALGLIQPRVEDASGATPPGRCVPVMPPRYGKVPRRFVAEHSKQPAVGPMSSFTATKASILYGACGMPGSHVGTPGILWSITRSSIRCAMKSSIG